MSLVGLVLDLIGFSLIAWELLTPADKRLIGGTMTDYRRALVGIVVVIIGLLFQIAAQLVSLLG